MRIRDLVYNTEFDFNAKFRIIEYLGYENEPDTVEWYDSESNGRIPENILNKWISAINQEDDGTITIEFIRLVGEEN